MWHRAFSGGEFWFRLGNGDSGGDTALVFACLKRHPGPDTHFPRGRSRKKIDRPLCLTAPR